MSRYFVNGSGAWNPWNPTWNPEYPTQDGTHVKATTAYSTYYPYLATNPANSLTGTYSGTEWMSNSNAGQRFHIDLGSAKVINRIHLENMHSSGVPYHNGQ